MSIMIVFGIGVLIRAECCECKWSTRNFDVVVTGCSISTGTATLVHT